MTITMIIHAFFVNDHQTREFISRPYLQIHSSSVLKMIEGIILISSLVVFDVIVHLHMILESRRK